MQLRILVVAIVALLSVGVASVSAQPLPNRVQASPVTIAQAKREVRTFGGGVEPGGVPLVIRRCHRLSMFHVKCWVLDHIVGTTETSDAETGEVQSEEVTGIIPIPFIASVTRFKIDWAAWGW